MAALKRSKEFDVKRLSTKRPDGALPCSIMQSDDQEPQADSTETVYVLNDARTDVQHTMQNPRLRPNACTCHTATQGSTCHHQLAWLLAEYPYGMKAEKLVLVMLGQKFGYGGGCSLDDISPLTNALNLLQLELPSAVAYPVCASSSPPCQDLESAQQLAAAPLPGRVKLGRHKQWVMDVATRLCDALDTVDPCKQEHVMQFQHAELDAVIKACERMVSSETNVAGSNFCKKGDCSTARKKSFLEKKGKKQAAAQPYESDRHTTQPCNFQITVKPKTQTVKDATKKNMSAGAQYYQQQYDAKKSTSRQSIAKLTPNHGQSSATIHHSPPKHTPQKQKQARYDSEQPGRSAQEKQVAQLQFVERTVCGSVRAPLQPRNLGFPIPEIWDFSFAQGVHVGASGVLSGTQGALAFAPGFPTPAAPQPIEFMSQQTPSFGLEGTSMQPGTNETVLQPFLNPRTS
jgi:hypothetical protein